MFELIVFGYYMFELIVFSYYNMQTRICKIKWFLWISSKLYFEDMSSCLLTVFVGSLQFRVRTRSFPFNSLIILSVKLLIKDYWKCHAGNLKITFGRPSILISIFGCWKFNPNCIMSDYINIKINYREWMHFWGYCNTQNFF